MMGHEYQDHVSLEIARRVAAGLRDHPEWLELARTNLERWSERNADSPMLLACYQEWRTLLEKPIEEICTSLTAPTDESQRLRQNSPFAGALPPRIVWDIKKRVPVHRSAGNIEAD